jgi:hypothetical protein
MGNLERQPIGFCHGQIPMQQRDPQTIARAIRMRPEKLALARKDSHETAFFVADSAPVKQAKAKKFNDEIGNQSSFFTCAAYRPNNMV